MKNMTIEQFAMQTASTSTRGRKYFRPRWRSGGCSYRDGSRAYDRKEKICRGGRRDERGSGAYA